MYFLVVRQKFTANVVVGLLGNKSSYSNRLTLVTPKSENDVRLQAKLNSKNLIDLSVRVVRNIVLSSTYKYSIGCECETSPDAKIYLF